jgi:hypothetical protein
LIRLDFYAFCKSDLEVHIGAYSRTDSNDTVFYPAAIQETSMGNDRISDLQGYLHVRPRATEHLRFSISRAQR